MMPQLGETVTEGTITRWMKGVGDAVERDEPLFEVSTDKVDSEVPSPAAGVLTEILVPEGETVEVGVKLAIIGDGAAAPPGPATPPSDTAEPAATLAPETPPPAPPATPPAPRRATCATDCSALSTATCSGPTCSRAATAPGRRRIGRRRRGTASLVADRAQDPGRERHQRGRGHGHGFRRPHHS